jgi:hypothetical protein
MIEETPTQRRLRAMFAYLKGLNISGFTGFASYDEWKAAHKGQESLFWSKKTDLKGEAGFIEQKVLSEREEEFKNLSEEAKAKYRTMFGSEP